MDSGQATATAITFPRDLTIAESTGYIDFYVVGTGSSNAYTARLTGNTWGAWSSSFAGPTGGGTPTGIHYNPDTEDFLWNASTLRQIYRKHGVAGSWASVVNWPSSVSLRGLTQKADRSILSIDGSGSNTYAKVYTRYNAGSKFPEKHGIVYWEGTGDAHVDSKWENLAPAVDSEDIEGAVNGTPTDGQIIEYDATNARLTFADAGGVLSLQKVASVTLPSNKTYATGNNTLLTSDITWTIESDVPAGVANGSGFGSGRSLTLPSSSQAEVWGWSGFYIEIRKAETGGGHTVLRRTYEIKRPGDADQLIGVSITTQLPTGINSLSPETGGIYVNASTAGTYDLSDYSCHLYFVRFGFPT